MKKKAKADHDKHKKSEKQSVEAVAERYIQILIHTYHVVIVADNDGIHIKVNFVEICARHSSG